MSQQANIRYMNKLKQGNLEPVYLVLFDGVPTRFSLGIVSQAQGPTLNLVRNLTGSVSQVTVTEGHTSLGNTTVDILDQGGIVTKLAFQYQMGNRKVTVKAGFRGLAEKDFVTAWVGRVNNYTLAQDNVTWSFDLVNLFTDSFPNIFDQFCIEQGAITDADTTITVDSTNGFPAATAGVCYLVVDTEVISYTGITSTTFTGCARGQLGTTPAAHSDQVQINNLVVLEGNPLTLVLQIYTSTGLGTNGPYDVLPALAGLSIDQSLIDVAGIEQQRDRWCGSYIFRFEEFASVVGKQFLEQQIFTFCNAYPVTTNEGLLSVHVYGPPLPTQLQRVVDDTVLESPPTYSGNVYSTYFFNEVDLSYDYNFLLDLAGTATNTATGPYGNRTLYENVASQELFNNQAVTKTWQSRGMRTLITGSAVINRVAQRFLKRFSIPSPIMQAKVLYSRRLLQPAEIVPVTSATVPDLTRGIVGIKNKLMEILGIAPDYLNGTQELTLLDTGYSYGRPYAAISPTTTAPISFPTWDAASPAQRLYSFISRKIDAAHGVMSDGSDGYYITP